jgi:hypothetical protein
MRGIQSSATLASLQPEEGYLGVYANEIKRLRKENDELRSSKKEYEAQERIRQLEMEKMRGEVLNYLCLILFCSLKMS